MYLEYCLKVITPYIYQESADRDDLFTLSYPQNVKVFTCFIRNYTI